MTEGQTQVLEIIDKIKDEKLRKYLKVYAQHKNPLDLLGILDYLGFKLNRDSIDAIISQSNIDWIDFDWGMITLGGIILHGALYRFKLRIHRGGRITLEIEEVFDMVLYEQKEEGEKKDEKA